MVTQQHPYPALFSSTALLSCFIFCLIFFLVLTLEFQCCETRSFRLSTSILLITTLLENHYRQSEIPHQYISEPIKYIHFPHIYLMTLLIGMRV